MTATATKEVDMPYVSLFEMTTKELRAKYIEVSNLLVDTITNTKAETVTIKKEELFKQVMNLAWDETSIYLRLNPEIRMHPREYIYRELCGFPKETK